MDKVNLCNPPIFHSILLPHEKNERIVNSTITKLEAYHYPDDTQRNTISNLLDRFICTDSARELIDIKKQIIRELNNISKDIHNMREQIFSIVNRNTDQVYGILNENFTINDRDRYVKKLMYYHEIQEKITKITHDYLDGHFTIVVPELGYHHGSSLRGDMVALRCLINGEPAKVPDLTYNLGGLQYG